MTKLEAFNQGKEQGAENEQVKYADLLYAANDALRLIRAAYLGEIELSLDAISPVVFRLEEAIKKAEGAK